jgi:hypothetical protein
VIPRSSAGAESRRPIALVLVYTWDMLRAILALFGALAAFGDVQVGNRVIQVSGGAQVLTALSAASLAGALFVIGTLLPRHSAWVRRAQIVVLLMAIAMVWGSIAINDISTHSVDRTPLYVSALFSLVDLVAVVAMTGPRVRSWYTDPGPVPLYVGGLIAFWAATSVAFVLLRSL